MLNPAGALVKVVQALIGVVQWIMERGAALMDFVGTVIDCGAATSPTVGSAECRPRSRPRSVRPCRW